MLIISLTLKTLEERMEKMLCVCQKNMNFHPGVGYTRKTVYILPSEEKLQAFLDLKNEAEIVNEIQLLQDCENFSYEEQWTRSLLGCYLSKYLDTPRLPLKVFESATCVK